MAPTDWQKIENALAAVRRHVLAGETEQALQAIDLAKDCLDPCREDERVEQFNTEFENWR